MCIILCLYENLIPSTNLLFLFEYPNREPTNTDNTSSFCGPILLKAFILVWKDLLFNLNFLSNPEIGFILLNWAKLKDKVIFFSPD